LMKASVFYRQHQQVGKMCDLRDRLQQHCVDPI
jgi:hypothetical protein